MLRRQIESVRDGSIKPSHLAVVGGIAADKLVKLRGWDRQHGSGDWMEAFSGLAGRLLGEGGRVQMALDSGRDPRGSRSGGRGLTGRAPEQKVVQE